MKSMLADYSRSGINSNKTRIEISVGGLRVTATTDRMKLEIFERCKYSRNTEKTQHTFLRDFHSENRLMLAFVHTHTHTTLSRSSSIIYFYDFMCRNVSKRRGHGWAKKAKRAGEE